MTRKMKTLSFFLAVLVLAEVSIPTSAGKGGYGGSAVAEILAAGLITGLLMSNNHHSPLPKIHAFSHSLMNGYSAMHSRHAMYPMTNAKYPMINAKYPMINAKYPMINAKYPMMDSYIYPIMHRPHYNLMDHALFSEAAASQAALTQAHLDEEIKALESQERLLEVALARARQEADISLKQLLDEETALPAAALLLETSDLVEPEVSLENQHVLSSPQLYQTAGSENESRYILPRIVRHFVQRMIRRAERH